jgi:hypothetical protein
MLEGLPIYTWLAALCAGIAASALFMLVSDLLSSVGVDKDEGLEDVKTLPIIFRMLMPLVSNTLPIARPKLQGSRSAPMSS